MKSCTQALLFCTLFIVVPNVSGFCIVETDSGNHHNLYSSSHELCKECEQEFCIVHNTVDRKIAVHRFNYTLDSVCMVSNLQKYLEKKTDGRSLKERMESNLTPSVLQIVTETCKKEKLGNEGATSIMSFILVLLGAVILTRFCNQKYTKSSENSTAVTPPTSTTSDSDFDDSDDSDDSDSD